MRSSSFEPTPAQRARWTNPTRQYVEWLERTLADTQARVEELSAGRADSNVLVRYHGVYPDHLLGVNVPVSFRLDQPSPGHEAGLVIVHHNEHRPGVLEIRTEDDALHITPQSSNTVRLRLGDW